MRVSIGLTLLLISFTNAFSCQFVCSESKGVSKGIGLVLCDPEPGRIYALSLDYWDKGKPKNSVIIDAIPCDIHAADKRIVSCANESQSLRTELVETVKGGKPASYLRVHVRAAEIANLPPELRDTDNAVTITFNASDCHPAE